VHKKKKEKYNVEWKVNLINCRFVEQEEGKDTKFDLLETKISSKTVVEVSHSFYSLHNAQFWRSNFQKAFEKIWQEQQPFLIQVVLELTRHMVDNLLTAQDWVKLQFVMTLTRYSKGDVIIKEGEPCRHLYWIGNGSVRLEKSIFGENIPYLILKKRRIFW